MNYTYREPTHLWLKRHELNRAFDNRSEEIRFYLDRLEEETSDDPAELRRLEDEITGRRPREL